MIFQHTIEQVLSHEKTQTARIWKDYVPLFKCPDWSADLNHIPMLLSAGHQTLYYVGQERAIQPGRGKKGVGRLEITNLAKQDVREYTIEDIEREGFITHNEFLKVWRKMHVENYIALVIQFELIQISPTI